jgi:hypothetical protein
MTEGSGLKRSVLATSMHMRSPFGVMEAQRVAELGTHPTTPKPPAARQALHFPSVTPSDLLVHRESAEEESDTFKALKGMDASSLKGLVELLLMAAVPPTDTVPLPLTPTHSVPQFVRPSDSYSGDYSPKTRDRALATWSGTLEPGLNTALAAEREQAAYTAGLRAALQMAGIN